jgi:glutamate-ammonia-ligase adenylyltransferase
LRAPGTLAALRAACDAGHLAPPRMRDLADAYVFLRRAEHRLQMVADRQTHALPGSEAGLAAFAHFFSGQPVESFAVTLLGHLTLVHAAFGDMLRRPATIPDLPYLETTEPITGPPALAPLGAEASRPWESWLAGRPRALRTERARELLRDVLPALVMVVQRQPQPDIVWARLDEFIHRLPAGVQIFSMLRHNPALLDRLGDILGAAPSLAEHLASVPAALEGLVAPRMPGPDPSVALRLQLADARGVDQSLEIASRFVRGEEFRLAVAELEGGIDQDAAGEARTALAEAAMQALLPIVQRDHARRYGKLRGGGMVVVALGKVGGREMLYGSDLDLMLIYDHPPEPKPGTGASKLPPSQYFGRLAQAVIAALTVPTRDGKLYDVDMRLRPSGGKGPVAVSLAAFERYHRESAWTWERLALTRARVVAGPSGLAARVEARLRAALMQGNRDTLLADTAAMRRRLAAEMRPSGGWDIKRRAGGLREVEFVAQALQLRHAGLAKVLDPTTRVALARLAEAGVLQGDEAGALIQADRVWRAALGLLRMTAGRAVPPEGQAAVQEPVQLRLDRLLDRLTGASARTTVAARLDDVAAVVRAAFIRHVGELDEH